MFAKLLTIAAAVTAVSAEAAPGYSGWNTIWTETFAGSAGQLPNTGNWNIITGTSANNEWQTYTSSTQNLQLSGGATLQIVPLESASGAWTSGRVESTYTFTPTAGRQTMAEAKIRFGSNAVANKAGLWPAFWTLGDSIRHGTAWPECGELDILETVNGLLTGYGTVHCDQYPGGACNEPTGIGGSIAIPDQGWHTWRIVWDRRASVWTGETITWFMDGTQFQQVTGARIGNQAVWNTLVASPLYFILNVAVGGDWPGAPNANTLDGYGSMMEVDYVAQYLSS
ncbi:Uu.00g125800.m01.CDS01 [Anthostomella pinea]|uniref:Uu.00g125800.m01.CDS01 n=1 Tax=Anthostomella pinea TaxID=933095 RepID=A0AAI8VII7_9PEZI|nr:Uu.00g125800.m01.CDS01 [Anthostomella pinea]